MENHGKSQDNHGKVLFYAFFPGKSEEKHWTHSYLIGTSPSFRSLPDMFWTHGFRWMISFRLAEKSQSVIHVMEGSPFLISTWGFLCQLWLNNSKHL
jgi:hypothetical protein